MDDDYKGKNYRGLEKKKRIALKDMMEDYYIEESDFLDYNPKKDTIYQQKDSYPHYNSYQNEKKKPTISTKSRYFKKKYPVNYFHAKSSFSENFDFIKRLIESEQYKNRIFLRIKQYLDMHSRIALSLTCKHFYKDFYCDESSGVLLQSYVSTLQSVLSSRGIYLFCKMYKQNVEYCLHHRRYIYNGTEYFKGKVLLQGVVDSIEITSKEQLGVLDNLNRVSNELIKPRFQLTMVKQQGRDELYLWQAVMQQTSKESHPHLSRKYMYEESIKSAKFISDEMFYVVTESANGYSCLIYAAKIDGIENYLNQSPDEFQKASAPICHVICYNEYSEDFENAWTKPILIEREYVPDDITFLVSTEHIYVISKAEGNIDVINIKDNKLIKSLKVDNKAFCNYLESPKRNFFAVDNDNYYYHMIIQHSQNPEDVNIQFKKLETPVYKSTTHNIHHAFTEFYDSNNVLSEYFIYYSGPNHYRYQIYNLSNHETTFIEDTLECLAWNAHRGRIMSLTETLKLKIYDVLKSEQIFLSEKLNPFKQGLGRVGLVFDSFHVLIAVQLELINVEVYSFAYPLNQVIYLNDHYKSSPESWRVIVNRIGEPELHKQRYLDMKYDNCHFYMKGENGSVLIDFLTELEIPKKESLASVDIVKLRNMVPGAEKLKKKKKTKTFQPRLVIEDHISKLNYIPEINNKLNEDDIIERDYVISAKNWNLPEEQRKDWPEILEESKNLSLNEKLNLVASLYRSKMRGHDLRLSNAGKELDHIIKISNERKKKIGRVRTKQRDEKHNI